MKSKQDNVSAVQKWRRNTKTKLVKAMGGKCQGCGYDTCNQALELHHIDPTAKELNFSKVTANPTTWDRIMNEAKKCVLVCSNCHKEIHYNGRKCPIPPKFIEPEILTNQPDMMDDCSVCGKSKPVLNTTCSRKCAGSLKGKVDWDDVKLKEMIDAKVSYVKMAKHFKCSDNAVRKRCKSLGIPHTSKYYRSIK